MKEEKASGEKKEDDKKEGEAEGEGEKEIDFDAEIEGAEAELKHLLESMHDLEHVIGDWEYDLHEKTEAIKTENLFVKNLESHKEEA